jgi:hypothetical protein
MRRRSGSGQSGQRALSPTCVGLDTGSTELRMIALSIAIAILIGVSRYPLPWLLAPPLLAYVALLCRCPAGFLLILPIVVPAWDLGLWTGWTMLDESDFFIAATVAVLLVRQPPNAGDLRFNGASGLVLLAFVTCWLVAAIMGMASKLGAAYSSNEFLRPDNAIRVAKGLLGALVLLPFLRQRQRRHGDAVSLLGHGLAAGLGVVTLVVLAERALFPGILDFAGDYRVAGPFSSMRVGGGHIGAYAVLALPFAVCLSRLRPLRLGAALAVLAFLLGGYTIVVTFARTAYAACLVAMIVTGLGCLFVANRRRIGSLAAGIAPAALIVAALAVAAVFTGMHERFAATASDFLTRQQNWSAGLAVRDRDLPATMFGMGLGTYQRTMLMRSPVNRPSDLGLGRDDLGRYASMRVETPFFLGQKIAVPPTGALHLSLRVRSGDDREAEGQAALGAVICDKVLLYSDNCRGSELKLTEPNTWTSVQVTVPAKGLGSRTLFGLLRRPVELSLYGPIGHRLELRDIELTDDSGVSLLANGAFAHDLDRWIFTDDSHVSWRMLNQYLMLFFETGIMGLAAFLALAGVAIAGGVRALKGGSLAGAAVAGAVAGFLVSGVSDNILEAPRVATLFFLVCCCGLMQWEARSGRQ